MACCGFMPSKTVKGILKGSSTKIDSNMLHKPLIQIFEDRLKSGKIPEKKTAVHFGDSTELSFVQLNTFASCLARVIIERLGYDYKLSMDKDLVVAICLPMSEKAIALILAILKTGAAYLPLDPEYPEELLLNILNTFKPALLITDDNNNIYNKFDFEEFTKICKINSIQELWLDIDFSKEPKTRRPSMEIPWDIEFLEESCKSGNQPIVIMHCPGLKCENQVAVRVGTKSILNLVQYHWNRFKMTEKDICCMTVSISSPNSIPQLFIPILLGCSLHLFRRRDVNDMDGFLKNVSWQNITRLSMPTHHLKPFVDTIEFLGKDKMIKSLKSLKYVLCRGSAIPHELARQYFSVFKNGVPLHNCCGSVQTTGEIVFEVYDSLKNYESKLISGRSTYDAIVDNVKIYILDHNMNLVENGDTGEICVSGICLPLGYAQEGPKGGIAEGNQFIKNPFDDSSPPFERLYKTGEYGRIVRKGRLFMDDRHDLHATQTDDDGDLREQRKW